MPSLNWIGKEKVINHHNDVPFKLLEKKYSFNANESKNMIIQGDNLYALKSLLPKYEGRIDFVYIDPPYGTGNEGWVYNDNINDPRIKKWIGQVVGVEDLSRPDKWLCMMYPRLKLINKLMSEDAVLFISIDDNMQPYLKIICEEIFGSNMIEQYIWCLQDKTEGSFVKTAGLTVRKEHEYIVACFKSSGKRFKKYKGKRSYSDDLANPDNDPRGGWFSGNISRNGIKSTTGSKYYTITNPAGISFTRNWTLSKEEYEEALADNRIYFSKGGAGVPRLKIFGDSNSELIQSSLFTDVHTSITGKNQLKQLFDGESPLQFPKPSTLIYRLLEIASEKNSICLDCFAGSGTTGQAVLEINHDDGGKRAFIEIEMLEYAETTTATRAKRVIQGYGQGKNRYEARGGDFSFYTLGESILLPDGKINPEIPENDIKRFIYYTETHREIENETGPFAGINETTAYYIFYSKNEVSCLSFKTLDQIDKKSDSYVIYADTCTLSKSFMEKNHIIFKKIPRDIQKI